MTLTRLVPAVFFPASQGKPNNGSPQVAASLFLHSQRRYRLQPVCRQLRAGLGAGCQPVFTPHTAVLHDSVSSAVSHLIASHRGDRFPSAFPFSCSSPGAERCHHMPALPAGSANIIIPAVTNVIVFLAHLGETLAQLMSLFPGSLIG